VQAVKAALAVCLASAAAFAGGPRTSSLNWVRTDGAEGCIPARQLAEAVEKVLGRAVFSPASRAEISVEGRVERLQAPTRWKAILRITDEQGAVVGDRELETRGADCHEMDEALAFVIALMIDPDAAGRPPPAPAPVAAPPGTWQIHVEAELTGELGLLPSGGVGPGARVSMGPGSWAVEVTGRYIVSHEQTITPSAQVAWSWASGGMDVCPRMSLRAWTLSACGGVEAGALSLVPQGALAGPPRLDPLVLGTVLGRAQVRVVSKVFVSVSAGIGVPLGRQQYNYTDANGVTQPLFQVSAVTGTLAVGLGVVLE
jgi:hypothetical protein